MKFSHISIKYFKFDWQDIYDKNLRRNDLWACKCINNAAVKSLVNGVESKAIKRASKPSRKSKTCHGCIKIHFGVNATFIITTIAYQIRSKTTPKIYIFSRRENAVRPNWKKNKMDVEFKCQPHDIFKLKFAIQWKCTLFGAHLDVFVCVGVWFKIQYCIW